MVTWKKFLNNGSRVPWSNGRVTFAHFGSPVQQRAKDCGLIAALSSVTWTAPDTIWYPSANLGIPRIRLRYDTGQSVTVGTTGNDMVAISDELPLGADNLPAWAIARTTFEYWVPFYEKAYGSFLIYMQDAQKPGGTVERPIWPQAPWADPLRCISHLTGKKVSKNTLYHTGTCDTGTIWNTLLSATDSSAPDPSRKIKYAAAAWTHPHGSGVEYPDSILVEHHAYSLLGIHEIGAKKYVLLRNPHGVDASYTRNAFYELAQGSIRFTYPDRFTWDLFTAADGLGNRRIQNGVFAIRLRDFKTYFAGFGWVL